MNYTSKTSYTLSSAITTIHNYSKCRFLLTMIDHWDFTVQGTASINYVAPYILHILHTQHILQMNYTSKTSYTLSSAITTIHTYSTYSFLLTKHNHWNIIAPDTAFTYHMTVCHYVTAKAFYLLLKAFLFKVKNNWNIIVQDTAFTYYVTVCHSFTAKGFYSLHRYYDASFIFNRLMIGERSSDTAFLLKIKNH